MKVSQYIKRTFAPLIVSRHYEVLGSALTQVYKSVELAYEPNRAITPTVILPMVSVTDPDGVYPNGSANSALGNIKWYLNGVDITTTQDYINGLFAIDNSDSSARGALTVSKNISAESLALLSFRAVLPDTRRSVNIDIAIDDIFLSTQAVTSDKYTVEIDKPVEYIYNPLVSGHLITFSAVAFRGVDIIANNTAGITFSLLKKVAGNFVAISSSNAPECSVTSVGVFQIDMRLVAKNDYTIKMFKDAVEVAAVQFSAVRQYPVFTVDMISFGDVQRRQAVIPAQAIIHIRGAVVASPGSYFSITWHTVTTTKGDVTHNMGETAEIPTDKTGIDTSNCEIYCDVAEKPAMGIASDGAGVTYGNSTGTAYIFN
jgi:hypothetical protein